MTELICTHCPLGCILEVDHSEKEIHQVKGNRCKKGRSYAETELFCPQRIVTTTVRITGAATGLLPVRTKHAVPKDLMFEVIDLAAKLQVQAPIVVGTVVAEDILDTGVDLIATLSIEAR